MDAHIQFEHEEEGFWPWYVCVSCDKQQGHMLVMCHWWLSCLPIISISSECMPSILGPAYVCIQHGWVNETCNLRVLGTTTDLLS